ncbi:MAG: SDR family oxidoreductase [Nitrospirae bacterium]|nr:SDR family oxidoreductase [Nitrospirota bacterium]
MLGGRVALVTGGGTGIGKAIALALARAGSRVAVCGRRESVLNEAVAEIEAAGGTGLALRADVTDRAEIEAAVEAAASAWGRLDILVNNAGASGRTPIDSNDDARWHAILAANLTGTFYAARAALRKMEKGGRIINVSSVLGKFGVPGYAAYCAAKHGVIGFTRSVAMEVASRGITVNAICPGWVETEMSRLGMEQQSADLGIAVEEFRRKALHAVPIGRYVLAEEVAALAVYLASDEAAGMTGQAINICGGATTN